MTLLKGPIEFLMGSPPDEDGHDPDEVRHRVRIGRPFAIAATEVTVAQYRTIPRRSSGPQEPVPGRAQSANCGSTAQVPIARWSLSTGTTRHVTATG